MTDLAVNPSSGPNLAESLNSALRAAPELGQSPGTAVGAATTTDPVTNAQALARGTQAVSTAQAGNRVAQSAGSGHGVFGWIGHVASSALHDVADAPAEIGNAAMTGMQDVGTVLNKPLSVVAHEYRYLHDVEARHGREAALIAGLGLVAGGAVGLAAGGLGGAVLGAEGAEYVEGRFLYHPDSWSVTADGNKYRDPNTHQAVSLGRDIASVITGTRTGIWYNAISGVIDGFFDLTADPLAEGGGLIGKARSLEGAPGMLGDLFGGTGIRAGSAAPEDVERIVRQYPSVRNAMHQIADMTSGEIAARYPALSPVAQRLGNAHTADEVQQVFEQVFRTGELVTTDRLPSMSFSHLALQKIRYGLANAPQVGDVVSNLTNSDRLARLGDLAEHVVGPSTLMRRFERTPTVYNPDNFEFSAREFDPASDYAAHAIYSLVRMGEAPHVAEDVTTQFLNTSNIGERIQIYRNALLNALAAKAHIDPAGWGEYANDDTRSAIKEALDTLTRGAMPGVSGHYGNAMDARDLSQVVTEDGAHHAAAVLPNQTGMLRIPSAREFRNASKVLSGARDTWGKIDDFAYRNVTQSVFKRLVLLSMSYAEHISLAEIIPNGLREGFTNLVRSGIQLNRALGPLSNEDAELHVGAIRSLVFKLLRMDRGEVPSNEDVQLAARYVQMLHGELLPAAIDSGHNVSNEVKSIDQTEHLFRGIYAKSPKALRLAKDFTEYGRSDEHFVDNWQKALHEMSLQPDNEVVRLGATEYLDAARSGSSAEEATQRAVRVMTSHLQGKGEDWLSQYERHYYHSTADVPASMSNEEDWSRVMMEHLKGATHAPDGTPHISLLSHVANGEAVPTDELDRIGANDRPLVIKGRTMVPSGEGPLNRITNAIANPIFGKVLNPFVNLMSREPLAFQEFKHQWRLVEPATRDWKLVMEDTKPSDIPDAEFYHGTNRRFTGDRIDPNPDQRGSDQLYGRGLYTTSDPEVALQYTGKGRDFNQMFAIENRRVYGMRWAGDHSPVLLNMDEKPNAAAKAALGYMLDGSSSDIEDRAPEAVAKLKQEIAGGDKSTGELYREIRSAFVDAKVPLDDNGFGAEQALDQFHEGMKEQGYDGLTHKGGQFVGSKDHDVTIFFNPRDVEIVHGTGGQVERQAPLMTEDEAMVTAMHRTATRSVRFVHNLNDRTQWTDTMRNFAPFYFAQEQAYRRMGRMLAEDPGAFRRYQMMITALQNFSARQQASNGTEYMVLPGTGFMTSGAVQALARVPGIGKEIEAATPVGMGWDIGAANVIFPLSSGFRPDVGPVLALPAEAIAKLFPEQASPSVKADLTGIATAIGGPSATEPVWEQLIPNTILQRLAVAGTADSSTFDSAFISTMQSLEYHHEIPPESAGPVAMQNFLDKVRNQTRILFVMKALVGAIAPVSPELQAKDYNFPAELQADITSTGSAIAGTQKFLAAHPDAQPWTVFRSHATTGISPLSTQPAEDWVNSHMDLIERYNYAALYFMPQLKNGQYSSEVYNEQIAQNLRTKFTPQEFLNQLYTMAANNTYYANYAVLQDYITKNGLTGTELYNAEQNFINWEAGFAAQHPIWAQQYYTPGDFASDRLTSTDRIEAVTQMRQMIANGEAPQGSLTDGIKTLLQSYDAYTNAVSVGKQDNYSSAENHALTSNWQNYLTGVAKEEPELSTVISSVFLYAPKGGVGNG